MLDQFRLGQKNRLAKRYLCKFFHEMSEIAYLTAEFACNVCFGDYENSFIFQSELDHKMDKKLRVAEIAARTGLSPSTVSRVLAGKANTSDKARRAVLDCARELGVMQGLAAGRLLLNHLLVFAPQRAFDERSDIFYYRVIQSINNALAAHEVRLRYCALDENDSDANLFLARMNEPETQAAVLLGIDDPHIHGLAADLGKPCVLINCRDEGMRLPSIAPDHRLIGQCAARYLFDMGHRAVMNVMCLRRYTMELRLGGIQEAWRARNLRFTASGILSASPTLAPERRKSRWAPGLTAYRAGRCPPPSWWAAILWPPAPSAHCKSVACGCRRMSR